MVSETITSTRPLSWTSIERTIPSSTIERRSSGSITARSFSVTCSLVGSGMGRILAKRGPAARRGAGEGGEDRPAPAPWASRATDERGERRRGREAVRGGSWRWSLALAVGLCLVVADAARAGRYTVVECGLGVGSDAEWVSTGDWFGPESTCGTSPNGPAAGVSGGAFLGALAGPGSVGGQQYAGWRWLYPSGVHLARLEAFEWHGLSGGVLETIGWRDEAGGFWQVWNLGGSSTPNPIVVEFPTAAAVSRCG